VLDVDELAGVASDRIRVLFPVHVDGDDDVQPPVVDVERQELGISGCPLSSNSDLDRFVHRVG
jgi:hypothetical protein